MLFDLRGAGRRRTVQAIYLSLAILMGGGLVLFGVGGNVGGGLLDAVKGNGSTSAGNGFEKRAQQLERRVRVNPKDARSWAELARVRYQAASSGDGYDQTTASFTAAGRHRLLGVEQAWERYVALTQKPSPELANLMVQALGARGIGHLDKAVTAMEIVIDSRPKTAALFAQLASLAYAAQQTRKGDLAADRAVALAPAAQRKPLRAQLDAVKTQVAQAGAQAAAQQSANGATTP
jgi:hypothetical protein